MFDSNMIGTWTHSQFLRHDLLIELGRLEMALDDVGRCAAIDEDPAAIAALQSEHVRIAEALRRLPQA
jgi:hypothetical protein